MPQPQPGIALDKFQRVVKSVGLYPPEAFYFVQAGLQYAAEMTHGPVDPLATPASRHITGAQLALGLREFAWERWGLMARSALANWGIQSTLDFGRIVFALIDAGFLQRQPTDSLNDFADVYDFASFEQYKMKLGSIT